MIAGIVLVFMGISIVFVPELLSIIVALFMIAIGVITIVSAREFKKTNSIRNVNAIRFIFMN